MCPTRAPVALAVALLACGGDRPPGAWRDQLVFVGDAGSVLPLVLTRATSGSGELKAWLGRGDAWQSWLYRRFPVRPDELSDTDAVLGALRRSTRTRASLQRTRGSLELAVRDGETQLHLTARALAPLGESRDPEGASRYRAGRATVSMRGQREEGWLLVEETPPERPHRAFVDYGDLFFVVAGSRDGVLALKRSRRRPAFDVAYTRFAAGARGPTRFSAELAPDALTLALPQIPLRAVLPVSDRVRSDGVAPDGSALVYETLLLRGELRGVAFVIAPASRGR